MFGPCCLHSSSSTPVALFTQTKLSVNLPSIWDSVYWLEDSRSRKNLVYTGFVFFYFLFFLVGINENFCHCINRGIAEANYKTEKSLLEPTGYLSPTTRPSTKYYAQMIILHERLPLQSRHYKVFGHNSDDLLERSRYGKRRNIRQTKTVIIVNTWKWTWGCKISG